MDMGVDAIRAVQLKKVPEGISMVASANSDRPAEIPKDSSQWQQWAINAVTDLTGNGRFKEKNIISAMPVHEVFIDHIKSPVAETKNFHEAVLSKIRPKLPFTSDDIILKYIPTEDNNLFVAASERIKVNRYLAIYEKSGLRIKSLEIWPLALVASYVKFFGRRKSDAESVVMLLDVNANFVNLVACRSKNLLFACSLSIEMEQLANGDIHKLVLDINRCRRQFISIYKNASIDRVIFLAGNILDRQVCAQIAEQLQMPAHMGDCLAAVNISSPKYLAVERRASNCDFDKSGQAKSYSSWAVAFGLGLCQDY